MTREDDKIVTLDTGYHPEEPPITTNAIESLEWSISLLADEVRQLSVLLNKQVRSLVVMNAKLNDISKQTRK